MKILLVDDESFIRMSLKTSLDWGSSGYQIIGEANHGQDALHKISELKPDIVLLDIKMPIMDGLEVLKALQSWENRPKVIMLSSYKEFDYVREGMRMGAIDYIHKPSLSKNILLDTLQRTSEMIVKEHKQSLEIDNLRQNIERTKPNMKALFLKDWVEGAIRHEWEVEEKIKLYTIRLKQPNLTCFAMRIDHFSNVRKRYKEGMEYLLIFSIQNILTEVLHKFDEVEFIQTKSNEFTIMKTYSCLRSTQEIYAEQWNLIKVIQQTLRKFLNINVSFGVSALHSGLLDVPIALKEAEKVLERHFYGHGSSVNFYQKLEYEASDVEEKTKNFIHKKIQYIKLEIANKQWDRLQSSLKHLFDELQKCGQLPRQEIVRMATYLHNLLIRYYEGEDGLPLPGFPANEDFTEAETQQQIYDLLILEALLIQKKESLNSSSQMLNPKIRKVIDYIHKHYTQNLKLEELSDYVGLNSSYLSRLFKEQTGVFFVQYINQYRINKSLDMLKDTTMKTYEIAEAVGFNSTDNFYIVFKRLVGYAPNEVRKKRY